MANVKSVIALLCKHINLSLNLNVKPEHFRLAKFDKTDENVVHQMWNILERTTSKLPPKNDIHSSLFGSGVTNIVNSVKQYFALLNYESVDFYCLPSDMSYGSRELLLAFAWLVLTANILEKLLVKKLRKSLLNQEFYDEKGRKEHPPELSVDKNERTGPLDQELNYILWVTGKIENNLRAIAETEAKRLDLATQVHRGSMLSCGLPHVSVTEARLARQPELVDGYLAEIEPIIQLLETHRQWGSKSGVFWDWMGSVLEEKQKFQSSTKITIGQKKSLVQFVNFLRSQLNSTVQKSDCGGSSLIAHEETNGVGRLIVTSEKSIKLNDWLVVAELKVKDLESECNLKASNLRRDLSLILAPMKGIEVFARNLQEKQ